VRLFGKKRGDLKKRKGWPVSGLLGGSNQGKKRSEHGEEKTKSRMERGKKDAEVGKGKSCSPTRERKGEEKKKTWRREEEIMRQEGRFLGATSFLRNPRGRRKKSGGVCRSGDGSVSSRKLAKEGGGGGEPAPRFGSEKRLFSEKSVKNGIKRNRKGRGKDNLL